MLGPQPSMEVRLSDTPPALSTELPAAVEPVLSLSDRPAVVSAAELLEPAPRWQCLPEMPLCATHPTDDSYWGLFIRSRAGGAKPAEASCSQVLQACPVADAVFSDGARGLDSIAHASGVEMALPNVGDSTGVAADSTHSARHGMTGRHPRRTSRGCTGRSRGAATPRTERPCSRGAATQQRRSGGGHDRQGSRHGNRRFLASASAPIEEPDDGLRAYLLAVLQAAEEARPATSSHAQQAPSLEELEAARRSLHSSVACSDSSDACAICLEEMQEGQLVARLPCRHCFHTACIHGWLPASLTCPLCKQPASL